MTVPIILHTLLVEAGDRREEKQEELEDEEKEEERK